jgi:hypothetical protein
MGWLRKKVVLAHRNPSGNEIGIEKDSSKYLLKRWIAESTLEVALISSMP